VVTALAADWQPRPLSVEVDLAHGGRWTSLRTPEREWLWARPDPARARVSPGDAFVDAGGVEECFPTVRGTPDHGSAWSRPWRGEPADAEADADGARLRRRVRVHDGAVTATYDVHANPGFRFVHATHALLDLSTAAYVDAPADRVLVTDDPRPLGVDTAWDGRPVETGWPDPWGLPLHRFGPADGTALGMVLPGCRRVTVVDGSDALILSTDGAAPLSTALWRNLGGFPAGSPYRSTGVEPMVGSSFDRDGAGAAVVPESGVVSWTLRCTAWRRFR
jgi:hypothetical protein